MKIGHFDDGYNDPTDDMDDIELGFRRYMYLLHEEYMGNRIPIEEESFCRAVDHYLMELYPKITEKNIKNFHHKLFNKCNEMMMCGTFEVPEKMREPIRLASM